MEKRRMVGISNWYLFFKLLIHMGWFIVLFVFILILSAIFAPNGSSNMEISAAISLLICLVRFIGDVLYWKRSGIFTNEEGDHKVIIGGWFFKEDKLLNGVVIANQITRNPIEQLFGMACIQAGVFFDGKVVKGVRHKDIVNYDNMMRKGNKSSFRTMF